MIEFLLAVPYMVSHLQVSCLLPLWERLEDMYVVSFFVDEDGGGKRRWKKEVCSRIRIRRKAKVEQ